MNHDRLFAQICVKQILEDRYIVRRVVGRGGMGAVFRVEDLHLPGQDWALKAMPVHPLRSRDFMDEARLLIDLRHPHLPHIVDAFTTGDEAVACLVMEWIPGLTLQQFLTANDRFLSFEQLLACARQLCAVLCYLHDRRPQPVVHRDLKPANVMVTDDGMLKLIDFGIATRYKNGRRDKMMPVGTAGFSAPEQYRLRTDARSDIYSLGALLYYLMSGGLFVDQTLSPVKWSADMIRPDIPHSFVRMVSRMTRPDPEDRYQEMAQIVHDLSQLPPQVKPHLFIQPSVQTSPTGHDTSPVTRQMWHGMGKHHLRRTWFRDEPKL